MRTVVGLYDRIEDARDAVQALQASGVPRDEISLIARNSEGQVTDTGSAIGTTEETTDGAKVGATAGGLLGGIGGVLVGLGALAIPGIGPVLAAGPLAAAIGGIAGAGVGAAAGGLLGGLTDLGIPETQANAYAEGVRRGSILVTARVEDHLSDTAVQTLNRFHPIDINQRMSSWRNENWTRFDEGAEPLDRNQLAMDTNTLASDRSHYMQERNPASMTEGEDLTIPVVEEDIRVGKREVETGGVRINTEVTERPVEEQVNLRQERVEVERRPVDRPAGEGDFNTFQEGTIEMTERAEEAVVEKTARVVEEVTVRKDVAEQTETIRDTVRRKDVFVERFGENWTNASPGFRQHYTSTYGASGHDYDYYEPAYAYGYELANDQRYHGRQWNDIEMDIRRDWETRHPDSAWDDVKDAVRNAWHSITR